MRSSSEACRAPTVEQVTGTLVCACCRTTMVEPITLDRGRGPEKVLRVPRRVAGHRVLLGYCRTVAEVAAHVDLAVLVDAGQAPG